MPSTSTHHKLTKAIFGDSHEDVHKLLDSSVQWPRKKLRDKEALKGLIGQKSHREDVVHNLEFWKCLLIMGKISPEQYLVAYTHLLEDRIDSGTNHGLDRVVNPRFEINRMKAKLLKGINPNK